MCMQLLSTKKELYKVRIIVGRDKLDYHNHAGSPTANLLEMIFIIESTIWDMYHGGQFIYTDKKDYLWAISMKNRKCIRVIHEYIPLDIT